MATFVASLVAAVAGSIATYILAVHMGREKSAADEAAAHAWTVELVLRELVKVAHTLPGGEHMVLPPGW